MTNDNWSQFISKLINLINMLIIEKKTLIWYQGSLINNLSNYLDFK